MGEGQQKGSSGSAKKPNDITCDNSNNVGLRYRPGDAGHRRHTTKAPYNNTQEEA